VIAQQAEMTLISCISVWRYEADKLYSRAALEMKLMSCQPLWLKTTPKSSSRPATSGFLGHQAGQAGLQAVGRPADLLTTLTSTTSTSRLVPLSMRHTIAVS